MRCASAPYITATSPQRSIDIKVVNWQNDTLVVVFDDDAGERPRDLQEQP
jgi:hypothetical protein